MNDCICCNCENKCSKEHREFLDSFEKEITKPISKKSNKILTKQIGKWIKNAKLNY